MSDTPNGHATITREDLRLVASIAEKRLAEPELELKRLVLVRRVLSAAFELDHTLRAQTRCALVNHCGTPGVQNLTEATERLFGALCEYTLRISELVERYRTPDVKSGRTDEAARPDGPPRHLRAG
jgi:hypothetical protein